MATFLTFTNTDGQSEYVNLADIAALLVDDEDPTCTVIYLQSDPDTSLSAKGTPTDVIRGRLVTLGKEQ